jgi:Reverse transcriptase (RNA-dependent DNA polymerase).
MDCNNYRDISLLSTLYKILSNILLSRMTPYANEIIGEYQCSFGKNRSTIYLAFGKYLKRNGDTIRTYVSYL